MTIPSTPSASQTSGQFLRREDAARYVRERFGAPCSRAWLAKIAVTGGGPTFRKIGRFPVYSTGDLDDWVRGRMTAPRRSTSEVQAA